MDLFDQERIGNILHKDGTVNYYPPPPKMVNGTINLQPAIASAERLVEDLSTGDILCHYYWFVSNIYYN